MLCPRFLLAAAHLDYKRQAAFFSYVSVVLWTNFSYGSVVLWTKRRMLNWMSHTSKASFPLQLYHTETYWWTCTDWKEQQLNTQHIFHPLNTHWIRLNLVHNPFLVCWKRPGLPNLSLRIFFIILHYKYPKKLYIYKKLDTNSFFAKLFSFFYTPCITSILLEILKKGKSKLIIFYIFSFVVWCCLHYFHFAHYYYSSHCCLRCWS